ncbi:hypothetical protein SAMN06296008_1053 [Polynucleobacter kasalickyi]|uniref:HTH deoR-type domain-containing protein n=2 Tax=Polynucleobacter kasalickyi TaxID=1938817 RepID=A0A1W1ZB14_9BURK|nr:hypothetical protein SAMN06296008_1053 [Polynucleobacter kasalickyi]
MLSILILITVLDFEKRNIELSLKKLYLELGQFSDVTIRKDLNRLSKAQLLNIETPSDDLRSKIITSSPRLKSIELRIANLNCEQL